MKTARISAGSKLSATCQGKRNSRANSKAGTPSKPDELAKHACVLMRFGESIDRQWPFIVDGKPTTVLVSGPRIANDGALVRQWCLDGHGIALKSIWDVKADLTRGMLVEILADFAPPPSSLQVVYPGGRNLPRRIHALINHLAEHFANA